jgi:ElaB/YqjD/DUF883 family membrane-anchored ribosome-binding protein
MLSGAEQAYEAQLESLQRVEQEKEGVKTVEQQGGLLGLFEGKKRLIDAFKKKINDKVDELTEQAKGKAQEFVEGIKGKAEDVMGQVQEGVEGLQQQAGEALGQVQEGVEGLQQQAGEMLQGVRQRFNPLSDEDYDNIKEQLKGEIDDFKNQLVPTYEEQDAFDLEGENILKGANALLNKMKTLDPESRQYQSYGRILSREKSKMESVMDRKEAETGSRELRMNRQPTEEEYSQIEQFAEQRHQELLDQRSAELNPEPQQPAQPSGQIGQEAQLQAPEAEVGQIGEEVQPITQQIGDIAESSFGAVRQAVGEAGEVVSQVGKTAAKEAGEAIGEGLGEELAGESSLLAVPGVGELLAPLAFIGSALGAIFGHKKQPRGPVMSGVSSQFGG